MPMRGGWQMLTEREVRELYHSCIDAYVEDLLLDVRRWSIRRLTHAGLFMLGQVLEVTPEGTDEEISRRVAMYKRRCEDGAAV